jgi:hypothetical protein
VSAARGRFAGSGLVALAAFACGEPDGGVQLNLPPIVAESKYLRLATDSDLPICDGTLAELDRYIEGIYAALDEPLPAGPIATYVWTRSPEEQIHYCNHGRGCTMSFTEPPTIVDHTLDSFHELAHAVHIVELGRGHDLLAEGFAEVFGRPYNHWDASQQRIEVLRVLDHELGWDDVVYETGGLFVATTIRRHGVGKFKELFRRVEYETDAEQFGTIYESVFGETLERAIEEVMASTGRPRVVAPTCADAPVPWSGDTWRFATKMQCDSDTVFGPGFGWLANKVGRSVALDVPADGTYEFTAVWTEPAAADGVFFVHLFDCDLAGPPLFGSITMGDGFTGELAAGRYQIEIEAGDGRSIEVTARRVGP